MSRKSQNRVAVLVLLIFLFILYSFSYSRTAAIVHLTEISEDRIVVVNALGERTTVKVPSGMDTRNLNEQSMYLVQYRSNLLRGTIFDKIEEAS